MGILDYKTSYRRNLPHLQPPGASFFVTARLAGSLPQSLILQWAQERMWLKQLSERNPEHFEKVRTDFERSWFSKFEEILDGSRHGPIWLKDDRLAAQVAESLHFRDGKVFRLDAYSIMPNHLHIQMKPLLRPLAEWSQLEISTANEAHTNKYYSLASILKSLKGYTARKCNRLLSREGEFWAHESFDHYIRDAEEWRRIRAYILNNPIKARLVDNWEAWKWSYRRKG